ncbi:MAG: hypothetical protein MJZ15_03890 [Bacteroidales bacterium]|nr:hypothetical protein [Bacteroidales bacterium]
MNDKLLYAISKGIESALNEMTYNQIMSLNEMSQINLDEKGQDKKCGFNEDVYYIYVKGEGGYKKFPHFHIRHKQDKWDIRMNMDGSFHSIKTKGGRGRQKNTDFDDIEKISKEWVKKPNAADEGKTNGEVASLEWRRNNS